MITELYPELAELHEWFFKLIRPKLLEKFRARAQAADTPALQTRRQAAYNFFMRFAEPREAKYYIPPGKKWYGFFEKPASILYCILRSSVEFKEVYVTDFGDVKLKNDFHPFNPFWNMRTKLDSEMIFEIDKLPWQQMINIFYEVCAALERRGLHYAVFYAAGGRSPHIRIYDFKELCDLNPYQREQAQLDFWQTLIPGLDLTKVMDKSVLEDGHTLALEFAPHFKHGTPFNLLWEYIPGEPLLCSI